MTGCVARKGGLTNHLTLFIDVERLAPGAPQGAERNCPAILPEHGMKGSRSASTRNADDLATVIDRKDVRIRVAREGMEHLLDPPISPLDTSCLEGR